MSVIFSRCALVAATAGALSAHADNQASSLDHANSLARMETTLVTASRTHLDIAAALASVDVMERPEIERLQSTDLMELLWRLPGLDFSRAGGPGAATSLFLRGTNADHTLFLLDGQRISSATLGSTNIQFIDPEAIERVEVVRGPRSSLYGSDAIGGVVQLFTRTPDDEPSAYIKAGLGKHSSERLAVGGDARVDQWRMGAYYSHYSTDGIDYAINDRGLNGDEDAYRNHSIVAKLGYDFANGASVDLNHFYTRAKNERDSETAPDSADPYSESWIQGTSLSAQIPLTERWLSRLTGGHSVDDSDDLTKYGNSHSHFRTERDSASWQNDFTIDDRQAIIAGVDYYEEQVDTSNTLVADGTSISERDNTGYFVEYLLDASPIELQLALRHDDHDSFGEETTGNIAVGFDLSANTQLIVSYGEGFRAPTFNDLYWPEDNWGSVGNPNLQPETSENYEVELRGQHVGWTWSLVAYHNTVENLIEWAARPGGGYWPFNVAEAEIEGATLAAATELAGWQLHTSFSYVDPRDKETGDVLLYRSKRTLSVDLDRTFGAWDIGASWRLQDHRYGRRERLAGYGIVDLRAGYRFDEHWHLQLKVDNALDREYFTRENYNQEQLTWFATVTYRL